MYRFLSIKVAKNLYILKITDVWNAYRCGIMEVLLYRYSGFLFEVCRDLSFCNKKIANLFNFEKQQNWYHLIVGYLFSYNEYYSVAPFSFDTKFKSFDSALKIFDHSGLLFCCRNMYRTLNTQYCSTVYADTLVRQR